MRFFKPKHVLKISIVLMIFILCLGSTYASNSIDDNGNIDDSDFTDDDYYDWFYHVHVNSNLDTSDWDDDSDDLDDDDDWDDDSDDLDDDDDWDDDSDDLDDDDDWDDDSDDLDDDSDDWDDSDWDDDDDWDDDSDDWDDSDWDDDDDWDDDSDDWDDSDWDDDDDWDDDSDDWDDSDWDDDDDWDDDSDDWDDSDWDDDSDDWDDSDWDNGGFNGSGFRTHFRLLISSNMHYGKYPFPGDFDFYKTEIISYLNMFGNCSDENWTESDEFNGIYQSYLKDNTTYTLNESNENYDTYLKIYNSIVSTFDEGNLTDNETGYLKFLIMYYLNNYGNCTNSTWEEYLEFYKGVAWACGCSVFGAISASDSAPDAMAGDVPGSSYGNGINQYMNFYLNDDVLLANLGDAVASNSTSTDNVTGIVPHSANSWFDNLVMLFVALLFVLSMVI